MALINMEDEVVKQACLRSETNLFCASLSCIPILGPKIGRVLFAPCIQVQRNLFELLDGEPLKR